MKTDKDNQEEEEEGSIIIASFINFVAIMLIAIGVGLKTELSNGPIIVGVSMFVNSVVYFIYTIKKRNK